MVCVRKRVASDLSDPAKGVVLMTDEQAVDELRAAFQTLKLAYYGVDRLGLGVRVAIENDGALSFPPDSIARLTYPGNTLEITRTVKL
jgi:hypothetical protein